MTSLSQNKTLSSYYNQLGTRSVPKEVQDSYLRRRADLSQGGVLVSRGKLSLTELGGRHPKEDKVNI